MLADILVTVFCLLTLFLAIRIVIVDNIIAQRYIHIVPVYIDDKENFETRAKAADEFLEKASVTDMFFQLTKWRYKDFFGD